MAGMANRSVATKMLTPRMSTAKRNTRSLTVTEELAIVACPARNIHPQALKHAERRSILVGAQGPHHDDRDDNEKVEQVAVSLRMTR